MPFFFNRFRLPGASWLDVDNPLSATRRHAATRRHTAGGEHRSLYNNAVWGRFLPDQRLVIFFRNAFWWNELYHWSLKIDHSQRTETTILRWLTPPPWFLEAFFVDNKKADHNFILYLSVPFTNLNSEQVWCLFLQLFLFKRHNLERYSIYFARSSSLSSDIYLQWAETLNFKDIGFLFLIMPFLLSNGLKRGDLKWFCHDEAWTKNNNCIVKKTGVSVFAWFRRELHSNVLIHWI